MKKMEPKTVSIPEASRGWEKGEGQHQGLWWAGMVSACEEKHSEEGMVDGVGVVWVQAAQCRQLQGSRQQGHDQMRVCGLREHRAPEVRSGHRRRSSRLLLPNPCKRYGVLLLLCSLKRSRLATHNDRNRMCSRPTSALCLAMRLPASRSAPAARTRSCSSAATSGARRSSM